MLKSVLRASCAAAAFGVFGAVAAQDYNYKAPDIHANACLYRDGRPVWHFIPANQVASDARLVTARGDYYPILRESGGAVSQPELYEGIAADQLDRDLIRRILDEIKNGPGNKKKAAGSSACKAAIEKDDELKELVKEITSQFNIGFSEAVVALDAIGQVSIPQDCKTQKSPDEFIQSLARELTEFQEENISSGEDPSAPIPYGAALNPGWHYVRVTAVRTNLAYDRRFWRKYYPALYTELQFDSFGSDKKAIGISAEDAHYRHDKNRVRRTLVMNQVVLPPTPYIDGELRAELSVLAVESYDYGRAFMKFLSNISNGISSKLASQAEDVFKVLDEGIRQLAGTNASKQFLEAGVAIDWPRPRTGYWLLIWPNKDFIKAYGRPNSEACPNPTEMATRGPLARLVQNRPGGKESFSVSELFYVAKTGPSEVTLLVKRPLGGDAIKPKVPVLKKTENADGSTTEMLEEQEVDHQYEPFDNATWALLRVDALSTNPNWQRVPGLLDAQRHILERMLQFYLPDFQLSGSYLGLRSPQNNDGNTTTTAAETVKPAADDAPNGGAANGDDEQNKNKLEKEKHFQEELTKDLQFYYGILMSSPDLLATDKYKIIQREQLIFQRHLHVLRTAELRDQLVSEAYRRWQDKVFADECKRIKDTLGEALSGRMAKDPCPEPKDETDTTKPGSTDTPPDKSDPSGSGDTPGETVDGNSDDTENGTSPDATSMLDLSPELVAARIDHRALALTETVDALMAANPQSAILAGYTGPDSIDGAMLTRIAEYQNGAPVRQKLAEYLSEILMAVWLFDSSTNTAQP